MNDKLNFNPPRRPSVFKNKEYTLYIFIFIRVARNKKLSGTYSYVFHHFYLYKKEAALVLDKLLRQIIKSN